MQRENAAAIGQPSEVGGLESKQVGKWGHSTEGGSGTQGLEDRVSVAPADYLKIPLSYNNYYPIAYLSNAKIKLIRNN